VFGGSPAAPVPPQAWIIHSWADLRLGRMAHSLMTERGSPPSRPSDKRLLYEALIGRVNRASEPSAQFQKMERHGTEPLPSKPGLMRSSQTRDDPSILLGEIEISRVESLSPVDEVRRTVSGVIPNLIEKR